MFEVRGSTFKTPSPLLLPGMIHSMLKLWKYAMNASSDECKQKYTELLGIIPPGVLILITELDAMRTALLRIPPSVASPAIHVLMLVTACIFR